ncbi:hypothetical protein HGT73_03815 [Rosenbergiella australiborealis]|uniref:Uncharacterized protein n=1 Tax=Rosenbergiella australiborealis TaxID=1544696 RepID=A0ABS5T2D6_9GAMM|nr:hypothetical protein [Rosenbergiella australiborealis]MBT0726514.1 hypothetical protein [Rosenbergiella australiborealis]
MPIPHSFSLWITSNLDAYQQALADLRVEYYLAERPLHQPQCTLAQLRQFNDLSLKIADYCYTQGDDDNYFAILFNLHQKLIDQLHHDGPRAPLFRLQALQLARHSMTGLCQVFIAQGNWQRASELQREFLQYADSMN